MKALLWGPWALVAELQRSAAASAVGPRTFGCDEALEAVLERIRSGESIEDRVARNLCANRAGKDRHRRRLARAERCVDATRCPLELLHTERMIAFVRQAVGDEDFALLLDVADAGCVDVSVSLGIPQGTLKSRVSRARTRARNAWAAACATARVSTSEAA